MIIENKLIPSSCYGGKLYPEGYLIHETAAPNGRADAIRNGFIRSGESSTHYIVDYDKVIQCVPLDRQCWGAGPTANSKYIQTEHCHYDDTERFNLVWKNGIELARLIVKRFDFGPGNIVTHHMTSIWWGETDHTDPDDYFAKHGKTFDQFVNEIFKKEVKKDMSVQYPQPWPVDPEGKKWRIDWIDFNFTPGLTVWLLISSPSAKAPGVPYIKNLSNTATIYFFDKDKPNPVANFPVDVGETVVWRYNGKYVGPAEIDFDIAQPHVSISVRYDPPQ